MPGAFTASLTDAAISWPQAPTASQRMPLSRPPSRPSQSSTNSSPITTAWRVRAASARNSAVYVVPATAPPRAQATAWLGSDESSTRPATSRGSAPRARVASQATTYLLSTTERRGTGLAMR